LSSPTATVFPDGVTDIDRTRNPGITDTLCTYMSSSSHRLLRTQLPSEPTHQHHHHHIASIPTQLPTHHYQHIALFSHNRLCAIHVSTITLTRRLRLSPPPPFPQPLSGDLQGAVVDGEESRASSERSRWTNGRRRRRRRRWRLRRRRRHTHSLTHTHTHTRKHASTRAGTIMRG
jgi:hypothetical protein